MIEATLALAAWVLLIGFLMWLLRSCLRVGAVGTWMAGDVRRSDKPIAYWISVIVLGASVLVMASVFIFAVWKMFLG